MSSEKLLNFQDGMQSNYEELLPLFKQLLHRHVERTDWCLDLGTGAGRVAFELAEKARWILGIDRLHKRIEKARIKAQNEGVANVQFIVGDVEEMNYEEVSPAGNFQLITTNLCLTESIIERLPPALDKGGHFVATCFEKSHWLETGIQSPYAFDAGELEKSLLNKGFVIENLEVIRKVVSFAKFDQLINSYLPNSLAETWADSGRISILKKSFDSGQQTLTESKIVVVAKLG